MCLPLLYRLSSYLGKPCLLQYGLNIEHSNEKLIQAQECETDTLAVYLVRLRRIAVDVDGLLANKSISDAKNQSSTTLAMTIASARRQLDEFMDRLPETLKTNCKIPVYACPPYGVYELANSTGRLAPKRFCSDMYPPQ